MPVRVAIIDDSAVVRQVLQAELAKAPEIQVILTAPDPLFALEKMKSTWPDVILLDIEMPRMDGLTFLRQIQASRPTPVIICSSLAEQGAALTLQALEEGAFAILTKPKIGVRDFLKDSGDDLISLVLAAAKVKAERLMPHKNPSNPKLGADAVLQAPSGKDIAPMTERFVAIGCSTGGTQALEYLLTRLPRTSPGIAIVQHMPEAFTRAFAERLNRISAMEVKEAQSGDRILPGIALIAPGGKHLLIQRSGAQYRAEVKEGPLVSRHRPSVDVLFRSVAKCAGRNATGIIMTGMGDDGAHGLKEMRDAGAATFAQDESSCVVFGMPKEAIRLNAVDQVVGLADIPDLIQKVYRRSVISG